MNCFAKVTESCLRVKIAFDIVQHQKPRLLAGGAFFNSLFYRSHLDLPEPGQFPDCLNAERISQYNRIESLCEMRNINLQTIKSLF